VIFKKLLTRRNKESSEVKQYLKPYPNDFTVKCDNSISLLKKAKGDSEKILASQAEQLFLDSIDWINNGLEIELESFLKLIQAIKIYVPGDFWLEGNPFRVDYDLYSEGIRDTRFFLVEGNQGFLLDLVGMGVDGQHLFCCIIQDHQKEVSPETVEKALTLFLNNKVAIECEHWYEAAIPGHPLIELIRHDLLTKRQLEAVFHYTNTLKGQNLKQLKSLVRLYLAKSDQVPVACLTVLAKDSETVWGWVDLEGNVKSESESIALSATFTLQHLPG
jgi:hypothetical protein